MNITGVDFVCVPTRDWEEAKDFYGDTLGLQRSKQWGNLPACEFETGSLTIALMQRRASRSAPTRWTAACATWRTSATPTATS